METFTLPRGSGGVRSPPPLRPPGRLRLSGLVDRVRKFVGEGHAPPGNLPVLRGSRDDLRPKSRACGLGLRNVPAGAVRASSPTEVCDTRRKCGSPVGTDLPLIVGAGFIPPRGRLRRRRVRRGEGTPPYGRPGWLRLSGLVDRVRKVCRGGAWPSREPSGAAGFRDDASIVPYRGLFVTRRRVFPVGRHVSPCSVGRAISPAAPLQIQKTQNNVFFAKSAVRRA